MVKRSPAIYKTSALRTTPRGLCSLCLNGFLCRRLSLLPPDLMSRLAGTLYLLVNLLFWRLIQRPLLAEYCLDRDLHSPIPNTADWNSNAVIPPDSWIYGVWDGINWGKLDLSVCRTTTACFRRRWWAFTGPSTMLLSLASRSFLTVRLPLNLYRVLWIGSLGTFFLGSSSVYQCRGSPGIATFRGNAGNSSRSSWTLCGYSFGTTT